MINWLSHPQIPDIKYLETPILTIELDSMDPKKKENKIVNNITFTVQNKD